jgi:hypothetical protein
MSYSQRLAVARLIHLVVDKDLRHKFCTCRRPLERFVDDRLQQAMDEVEKALASDSSES